MKLRRINRNLMYVLSFIACILVVNVGGLIVSHADENDVIVRYRTYTNESGWQDDAEQGGDCAASSTEALTGMKMMVVVSDGTTINGNVKYSVYSKEANWSQEVSAGSKASSGDNPIKAIKVELTDALANEYDIEYRVCTSDNEWISWQKNGAVVGNVDGEANIIAVQAKVNKKVVTAQPVTETATTYPVDTNSEVTGVPNYSEDGGVLIQNTTTGQIEQSTITPDTGATPDAGTTTPETNTSNSGNEAMEAFYNKVLSQLGQGRNASGNTVYGEWWASRVSNSAFKDAAWCAMFLSWCANEAGISEKTVGYFAACSYWQEFYKGNGRWHDKAGYTPKKGDLIFFDYTGDGVANHNGIVESVSDTKVVALEGNVNDKVDRVEYDINGSTILGYAEPDYANNAANVEADKQAAAEQQQQQEATGATGTTGQGGSASRILDVAISQIGTKEASSGWTKYGEWYDNNIGGGGFSCAAWCAMFVTWCANESGVPRDVIKPYAYCPTGVGYFKDMGVWHGRDGYTPKAGDVIFFTNGSRSNHTGIVEYIADGYVHTVEGNTSNKVARRDYPLNKSRILGYGAPNYN